MIRFLEPIVCMEATKRAQVIWYTNMAGISAGYGKLSRPQDSMYCYSLQYNFNLTEPAENILFKNNTTDTTCGFLLALACGVFPCLILWIIMIIFLKGCNTPNGACTLKQKSSERSSKVVCWSRRSFRHESRIITRFRELETGLEWKGKWKWDSGATAGRGWIGSVGNSHLLFYRVVICSGCGLVEMVGCTMIYTYFLYFW
jgi:hypothetical protein